MHFLKAFSFIGSLYLCAGPPPALGNLRYECGDIGSDCLAQVASYNIDDKIQETGQTHRRCTIKGTGNLSVSQSYDATRFHKLNSELTSLQLGNKLDARTTLPPDSIESTTKTYNLLSQWHKDQIAAFKNILNSKTSTNNPLANQMTREEIAQYAHNTVLGSPQTKAGMRDVRLKVSDLASKLGKESRYDEAVRLKKAGKSYTRAWGRYYRLLHSVNMKDKFLKENLYGPLSHLEALTEVNRGLSKSYKQWSKQNHEAPTKAPMSSTIGNKGDSGRSRTVRNAIRTMNRDEKQALYRHASHRAKGKAVHLAYAKADQKDINERVARLRLSGHEEEAERLRYALKEHTKAFGTELGVLLSVDRNRMGWKERLTQGRKKGGHEVPEGKRGVPLHVAAKRGYGKSLR